MSSLQTKLAQLFARAGTADHSLLGLTGVVLPFAGATAPNGWLLCTGQAVSRTTYSALYALIGTTYGAGDGSTTFNVPDLRGRVIAGADNMGGTAASRLTSAGSGVAGSLGSVGGAETHTLTTAQAPAHTHGGTAASAGAHTHTATAVATSGQNGLSPYTGGQTGPTSGTLTTASNGAHTHTISTDSQGGGGAHNNTQPKCCLNYIIKT